jgi:hypothetical protein
LWDLHTDDTVSFSKILDIWDDADPHGWNVNGNATGAGYPAHEMQTAAQNQSVGPAYEANAADNGIDR